MQESERGEDRSHHGAGHGQPDDRTPFDPDEHSNVPAPKPEKGMPENPVDANLPSD
ncbi:MAG: hypothetical protein ACI9PP_001414 [Halobacteriales archaeon]|jgi:hypothetical protein